MESPEHEPRSSTTPSPDARVEAPVDQMPRVRCILVLPETDATPPADLLVALDVRHVQIRQCVGVFSAMSALMICRRDSAFAPALVLVEPGRFRAPRAAELARAIGRYAPRTALWRYQAAGSPRLSRWGAVEQPTAEPAPVREPSAKANGVRKAIERTQGPPSLRLTSQSDTGAGEIPSPSLSPAEAPPVIPQSETLLTEEELEMLLSPQEPAESPSQRAAESPKPGEQRPLDSSYEFTEE